ncbi:MAG: ABC transporter ATP-binding protein [Akkermansiaceae bacterium]|nr:ABC transporter ATP-binding protein [Akkermansiaceae bacterium]
MSAAIISVEGVSKCYQLGAARSNGDGLRHKLDQLLRLPVEWMRAARKDLVVKDYDFWALQDLNFSIGQGEVVGVIGRNGAGKSTLLKILSRITEPSSGRVRLRGRVASLLEVGTGFHPELSGRENIYLNGAILGMRRSEIKSKFDEIVDFSEIEKFIDTPVKRYSSGMYVRLAFSVAAHLEPDVLIVDEILAVGDAAFQKKCLGKMEEASTKGGRTVLFVSHQTGVIQNLCGRCILLDEGRIGFDGMTKEALNYYAASSRKLSNSILVNRIDRKGAGQAKVTSVEFVNGSGSVISEIFSGSTVRIRVAFTLKPQIELVDCRISITLMKDLVPVLVLSTDLVDARPLRLRGDGEIEFVVERWPLTMGDYQVTSYIASGGACTQDWVEDATIVRVLDGDFYGSGKSYHEGWAGKCVLVDHAWRLVGEQALADLG